MRFFETDTDRHVIVYIQVYNAISSQSQTETLIFFAAQGHIILGANLAPPLFLLEKARELLFGQLAVPVPVVLVKHQVNLAKIMSVRQMFCVTCHHG